MADMQIRPGEAWEYCPRNALRKVTKVLLDEFNVVRISPHALLSVFSKAVLVSWILKCICFVIYAWLFILSDNEGGFWKWIFSSQKISEVAFPDSISYWKCVFFLKKYPLRDPNRKAFAVMELSNGFHMTRLITAQLRHLMAHHLYYKKYILLSKLQTLWLNR